MAGDRQGDDQGPAQGGKAGSNPTDCGKAGAERSVLTDGTGMPLGVAIGGANEHDKWLVGETLLAQPVIGPEPTPEAAQHLCGDKGYDYVDVRWAVALWGYTLHIKALGEEARERREIPGYPGEAMRGGADAQLDELVPEVADPLG